ncbi:Armadillo-like helical [Artemisia annua]|uniref:Armadillo-like helical n=1 Tax=Artemisia annua TaxID=35608 RepID=A0A2U1P7S7_ARTAN|nr:Armadillo-like helical [Artemisia annua]
MVIPDALRTHGELNRYPEALKIRVRATERISNVTRTYVTSFFAPPKVKAFIDKVIQCLLQDIAIPLSGFQWEYKKGNFHHWRPLFLHFDTYFKTYLS